MDDVVLAEVARTDGGAIAIDTAAVSAGQVVAHAGELRRLARNLLDNAVRHARSRVVVSLHEVDGMVELTIGDDGPGIPLEARDAVFERFVRLDAARSHDGGSGLGLAIARDIVVRHGGTITVDDVPSGARLTVRLPAAQHDGELQS
jgi:signal transduction histidine kinase